MNGGFFGGNQATIVAAITIITELESIRDPTDDSRFGIYLNNVLVSKSLPYEPMNTNLITLTTNDGPNYEGLTPELAMMAGLKPGAQVNATVKLIGSKQESNVDV